ADIIKIAALLAPYALSKSMDVGDIVSPADGDRYIVPVGGTGAFAGKDKHLAYYLAPTWYFIVPQPGVVARVNDTGSWWGYTEAGDWEEQAAPTTGSGFADAPNDGKRYVRKNLGWVDMQLANVPLVYDDTNRT